MPRKRTGKPPGRPPKVITDQHLEEIEVLAGYGMTEAQIAHILKMDPSTFRKHKTDSDRVSSALEKGQALAQSTVAQTLYKKATAGDMTAIIWWEKTRAGRHEITRQEHTGAGGGPIKHVHDARERLARELDRIAGRQRPSARARQA